MEQMHTQDFIHKLPQQSSRFRDFCERAVARPCP